VKENHDSVGITAAPDDEENTSATQATEVTDVKDETEKPKPQRPIPDLSSPIELESETIVTINSKKCVLKIDPETGKLRAYPLKPPAPAAGITLCVFLFI